MVVAGSGFIGNAVSIITARAGFSGYIRNMKFGEVDPAGLAVLGMDSNNNDPSEYMYLYLRPQPLLMKQTHIQPCYQEQY